MRKSTFIFGVLALMLFGVGTKMRAGITVQAIATIGDPITSTSSLKDGSKVILYNTGRTGYIFQSASSDNYLSFATAAPTVNTAASSEFVFELVASGTNYKLKALRSGKFLQTFGGNGIQSIVGAESTAATVAFSSGATANTFYLRNNNSYLNGNQGYPVSYNGTGANSEYKIYSVTTADVVATPSVTFANALDNSGTALLDGGYYRINLPGRGANYCLGQNVTAIQPKASYSYDDSQAWKFSNYNDFMKVSTPAGKYVRITYLSQDRDRVNTTSTETEATLWSLAEQNGTNHYYNMTVDNAGTAYCFSNNGGVNLNPIPNMGFYNVASDGGSYFSFTRLYKISFIYQDQNGATITTPSATVTCGGNALSVAYLPANPGSSVVTALNVTGMSDPTYMIDGTTKTEAEVLTAIQNVSSDLTITVKGTVTHVTYKYQDMAGYTLKADDATNTFAPGTTYTHPTTAIEGYTYEGSYTDGNAVADGSAMTDGQVIVLKYKLSNNPITASDAPTTTDWASNTTWYLMTLRGSYCVFNGTDNVDATASSPSYSSKELWCFVGDETSGYKIYNKAAGTTKILWTADRTEATDSEAPVPMTTYADGLVNQTWHLNYGTGANGTDKGFCFNKLGATYNFINKRANKLGEWVSSLAYSEVGSIVTFTPALDTYHARALSYLNGANCVGGYSTTDLADVQTACTNNNSVSEYLAAFDGLTSKTVIAFDANKYYRVKNVNKGSVLTTENTTLSNNANNGIASQVFQFVSAGTNATTQKPIYKVLANGKYLGVVSTSNQVGTTTDATTAGQYNINAVDATGLAKNAITKDGTTVNDTYSLHNDGSNKIVGWIANGNNNSQWYIIPATTFDLTVTSAGYATTYLPFNFTLPATGLKAYTMTSFNTEKTVVNATSVATDASTVLPKETGFVLGGSAATYTLGISSADATANIANNMLRGTLLTADLSATDAAKAYLLHATDGNENSATFYKLSGTQVNGNKAYLYDATTTPANAFTVSFGDITGINGVSNATEEANGVYYNLAGQRVNHPTKGVYIHNGKKLIVK